MGGSQRIQGYFLSKVSPDFLVYKGSHYLIPST